MPDASTTSETTRELVEAAEKAADHLVKAQRPPDRTQLSRLVTICNQASCGAEIKNYLRYQAARKVWPLEETNRLIEHLEKVLKDRKVGNEVRAWHQYATYLARAYLYRVVVQKAEAKNG